MYCKHDQSLPNVTSTTTDLTRTNLKDGLHGCGITISHGLSKYGLGKALVDAFIMKDKLAFAQFLSDWRGNLCNILAIDSEGLLECQYVTLAHKVADDFPCYEVVQCYVNPLSTFTASESKSQPTMPLTTLSPTSQTLACSLAYVSNGSSGQATLLQQSCMQWCERVHCCDGCAESVVMPSSYPPVQ